MNGSLKWIGEKKLDFNKIISILYGENYLSDYLLKIVQKSNYIDTKSQCWYIPKFITLDNLDLFCRWIVHVIEYQDDLTYSYSYSAYNVAKAYLHYLRETSISYHHFRYTINEIGELLQYGYQYNPKTLGIGLNEIILKLQGNDFWGIVEAETHSIEWNNEI
jgi:hypothetical protein